MIPLYQARECSIGGLNEQQYWKEKCEKPEERSWREQEKARVNGKNQAGGESLQGIEK